MRSPFRRWGRSRSRSDAARAAALTAARRSGKGTAAPPSALTIVAVLTIVLAAVIGVLAVLDLRGLAAESTRSSTPVGVEADRSGQTKRQVAVRVTVKADGPFTATITDPAKKQKSFESDGEDLVWTRVFEGSGPYVLVFAQIGVTGRISCEVEVDGRSVSEGEDSGTFVQAACAA